MTTYCAWCHQADEYSSLPGQPRKNTAKSPTCPRCRRDIALVTIRKACEIVGKSARTIHRWIEDGRVTAVRTSGGAPLICLSSLFVPDDEEFRECLRRELDPLKKSVPKRAIS
jgi:excisionase family DNA binding protein